MIVTIHKLIEKIRPDLKILLIFLVVGLSIYFVSFNAPFQMDDDVHITFNPHIKHVFRLDQIWNYDPFRFITNFTFAINYAISGLNVFGFHVMSFLIHIINTFLVYYFVLLILNLEKNRSETNYSKEIALAAAFIFLTHPLQTQPVIYITQRSTLLCALFYLLSLIFYIHWRKKGEVRYLKLMFWSIFISMFTKQTAISLPLSILLMEWCFFSNFQKYFEKNIKYFGIILSFSVLIPLIYFFRFNLKDLAQVLDVTLGSAGISRHDYLITQFRVLIEYFRLLAFPYPLNFDYDFPIFQNFFTLEVVASFLVLVIVLSVAYRLKKKEPVLSFFIFFFFVLLLLESSFFPLEDILVEHRLYLPVLSFAVVLAILVCRMENQRTFRVLMVSLIVLFGILTYQRALIWADPVLFLKDAGQKSPRKARIHNNLGIIYLRQGNERNAEIEFRNSIGLDPAYEGAYQNLAEIYYWRGDLKKAIPLFEKAMEVEPQFAAPYLYFGHIYYSRQDYDQAEWFYEEARKRQPSLVSAYHGLASVYLVKRDYSRAWEMIQKAIQVNPDNAVGYYMLGNFHFQTNNLQSAISAYLKAITIRPGFVAARNNLGNIYFKLKEWSQAELQFLTILEIDPHSETIYFNLANVYHELGRIEESERHLNLAQEIAQQNGNRALIQKIREHQAKIGP